jgi:hypothetical protein
MRIFDDARNGNLPRARVELRALLKQNNPIFFQQAQLYFAVHEPGNAYAALESAYAEHSWWLVTLMVDPGFASVRDQPQFRQFMLRIGLPISPQPSHPAA